MARYPLDAAPGASAMSTVSHDWLRAENFRIEQDAQRLCDIMERFAQLSADLASEMSKCNTWEAREVVKGLRVDLICFRSENVVPPLKEAVEQLEERVKEV
jgi:hypothetical protein